MSDHLAIRKANDRDIHILASSFRRMWIDTGSDPGSLRDDSADVVAAFVEHAQRESRFAAFIAEAGPTVVGTAACQIFSGLYPEIRREAVHLTGYIWGVYVEPKHRGRGIATRLTQAAIGHLSGLGCTLVKLHASPQGESVYRRLGFRDTNELSLSVPNKR